MKRLKITLAVIVVTAVLAGIFFWIQSIKDPEPVKPPVNQFTSKIEQEIEQLKVKPENEFCRDNYNEVAYHINEFYKPWPPGYPYGRFGNTKSENDQWKENLEKTLYSVYADKFIKQAFYVFHNSAWRIEDLEFIQSEKNELKRSNLLVAGSPVDTELTKIQRALNKYYEIESFISSCRGFGYPGTDLSDRFPFEDVKSKIQRAASLRSNHLENELVNNCSRLHDDLIEIPQILFRSHVQYLDVKIIYWSDMYSNYSSQKDYFNNLHIIIKAEIEALDNDLYNVSNFDIEYNRLFQKWSADNAEAYNFSYPR